MSCCSYIFYYITFSFVCPMEYVSVNKLRNMIRLKNQGFLEMPESVLIVQRCLLSLCLCICVPVLNYWMTYWWGWFFPSFLHHLVSDSDWMGCYLLIIFWPLFSHYSNAVLRWEFFFYPWEFQQLSPQVSQMTISAHSEHFFQPKEDYQPHFIDVKLS